MASIRTPDQRLRVFISSTMQELAEERAAVRAAIEEVHLIPVLFELGARPYPPRELYKAYLEQSQIFIGIYHEAYGWVAPDSELSGIEDEYDLAAGMPKLIYVKEPSPTRHPRLTAMLERIAEDGLSYRTFSEPDELRKVVEDDLAVLLSERFLSQDEGGDEPTQHIQETKQSLPSTATRFVGREGELRELNELLGDEQIRLITLLGPGGIGKTRLALEAARAKQDSFQDGVAAAMLAPIRSSELVSSAIATALGVPESAGRSAQEVLIDYLRDRQMLLVLDNFEQVVPAAPVISELLREAPGLRVIVTSRELLRLSGEHVFMVPPLGLSAPQVEDIDAVQLFVDRAKSVRNDLEIDHAVMNTIAEICRHLDGLPLAIELAAARVRVLTPRDILERLDNRLNLLTRGPSDLPERQRTLKDTIAWSYELLDTEEQTLFQSLGIFRGGFTLEAAEAVAHPSLDALEGIASLMDKSLIRADTSSQQPRFVMLETLREFAKERLAACGEEEEVRRRHAVYFLDWVSGLDTDHYEGEAVQQMERDNDNMRAALDWALVHGDSGRIARAGATLWKFWWVRSLFLEGIEWMEKAKNCPEPLTDREHADVEFVIGMLAFGHGDYPRAESALTVARAGYEEVGFIRGAALTWISLGVVDIVNGKDSGEELLFRAVKLLRDLGDDWAAAFALFGLGRVLLLRARPAEAVPLLEESVDRATRSGSKTLLAFALVNLGWARLNLPDLEGAREAIMSSYREAVDVGARDSMARAVEALAGLATAEARNEEAASLFGAAEAIRRSIGGVVWVPDRPTHVAVEVTLRSALGDDRYEKLFEASASSPLDDVLRLIPEDREVSLPG